VVNNKGYVFTPIVLFFLILVVLMVYLFRQGMISSVQQSSRIQGVIDKAYYNYEKEVSILVNDFKLIAYGNLSDSVLISSFNDSLGGILLSNNPVVPLNVQGTSVFSDLANVSYNSTTINVSLNYPVSDLINANSSFNPLFIQQCLDNNDCEGSREQYDSVFSSCIKGFVVSNFNLTNNSVPLLVGSVISVDLILTNNETTLLFPFKLGKFFFDC